MQHESRNATRTVALSFAFFAGALVVYSLLAPAAATSIAGSLVQTGIGAAISLAGVLVVAARAFKMPQPVSATRRRCSARVAAGIVLVALACGIVRLTTGAANGAGECLPLSGSVVLRSVEVVALYVLTALFEEPLFRVLLLGGLRDALAQSGMRQPTFEAVVCSSLVFGLLHLGGISGADLASALSVCQLVAKPLQASAFGACMALLVLEARSVWPAIVVHACYDVLALGLAGIVSGALPTGYLTGSWIDLGLYLVSGAIFLALTLYLAKRMHRG